MVLPGGLRYIKTSEVSVCCVSSKTFFTKDFASYIHKLSDASYLIPHTSLLKIE